MNVSSSLEKLRTALPGSPAEIRKDPRLLVRAILALLLVANVTAALFLVRPWAASPAELERRLGVLRAEVSQTERSLEQLRAVVEKARQARMEGDDFMNQYFMDRRTASSTIVVELKKAADASGVVQGEHTFAYEPVEGSTNLSMMTISGNYEGQYANLLEFINRIDRSLRFLILDTLTASPERTETGGLKMNFKMNAFVIEGTRPAPVENQAPDEAEPAPAPPEENTEPEPIEEVATE